MLWTVVQTAKHCASTVWYHCILPYSCFYYYIIIIKINSDKKCLLCCLGTTHQANLCITCAPSVITLVVVVVHHPCSCSHLWSCPTRTHTLQSCHTRACAPARGRAPSVLAVMAVLHP